jgi:polysaccharide biosynthesis/export protein
VRELLGSAQDLRVGTYMPLALLVRRDPATSSRVYEPVSLVEALGSGSPVQLRGDDRLYVFSQNDIEFLNRTAVRRIILGQPNPVPECRALARLEAIVQDTQSTRFDAITRGTFVLDRGGRKDVAGGAGVASQSGVRGELSAVRDESLSIREREAERQRERERQRSQGETSGEFSVGMRADDEGNVEGDLASEDQCPAVFEEEPDSLPVLLENAVTVGGSVRRPGAYPVAGLLDVPALISSAQGAAGVTGRLTLEISRADDAAKPPQRIEVDRSDTGQLAALQLRAGDDLRVSSPSPQFESGAVLLSGEFLRPGLYAIRKGEKLSDLIARAGGISSLAYPYGTVFTRRSVREAQREGLARTARELNTSLLASVSRRSTQPGSLDSALQLIDRLSSVEPTGRVVVESDPQVLSVRPELDTVLEAGDSIYLPKRPNFVLALGDVSNPGALQFVSGSTATEYLRRAGGYLSSADSDRTFLVLPNGVAQPLNSAFWRRNGLTIPPGSTLIVPKDIDPTRTLDLVTAFTAVFAQFATSIASIAILATQ